MVREYETIYCFFLEYFGADGYDGSLLLEEADPLETQFILPGEISG